LHELTLETGLIAPRIQADEHLVLNRLDTLTFIVSMRDLFAQKGLPGRGVGEKQAQQAAEQNNLSNMMPSILSHRANVI
jgi:hypothetical protein